MSYRSRSLKRKLLKQARHLVARLLLFIVRLSHTAHTHSYPPLSRCFSAQILTAQFRQMEQELAEAIKQREEERQRWAERAGAADAELAALRASLEAFEGQSAEVARQESELASLREAELVSQEALEKEKVEVARLERELALMKEAELAAVQASHDASERDRAEIDRLESELASMRGAVDRASQDASERENSEVEKLERELASLKEDHDEALKKKGEVLAEVWTQLRSLAADDVPGAEELPSPADHSLLLQSVETQLMRLRDERSQSQDRCDQLTHAMTALQGKTPHLPDGI